jgi:hypothetical protein
MGLESDVHFKGFKIMINLRFQNDIVLRFQNDIILGFQNDDILRFSK